MINLIPKHEIVRRVQRRTWRLLDEEIDETMDGFTKLKGYEIWHSLRRSIVIGITAKVADDIYMNYCK